MTLLRAFPGPFAPVLAVPVPAALISIALILATLVLATGAAAQAPAGLRLTAADRAVLERIEARVNGFRTLRTRFRQLSADGSVSDGDIFIQRPGLMRIQFDRRQLVLLTSRLWLIVLEGEESEPQHFPLNSTPAGILVREEIRFGRDVSVVGLRRTARHIHVTIERPDAPRQGRMTLAFDRRTLDLIGWTVVDAQGQRTQVLLSATQLDLPLDPMLFSLPHGRPPDIGSDR